MSVFHLGLTGFPLGHSLSPTLHQAALQSCGLQGSYSLFPIYSDDRQGLKELLGRARAGEIAGLNITIPHKQNVIEFLDELTPTAQSIGAVNTIYMRDAKLIGDNTDAPGFLSDLSKLLLMDTLDHKDALVLGAGGSARAIIYALMNGGWEVMVAARRIEQARELKQQFGNITVIEYQAQALRRLKVSLIVNTTPVGMTPNIRQSPWLENVPFPAGAFVYDLVYNPPQTTLVREARAQGLHAITGLGMLIEQAAFAFEIWTNHEPSRELMCESVGQSLRSTHELRFSDMGNP